MQRLLLVIAHLLDCTKVQLNYYWNRKRGNMQLALLFYVQIEVSCLWNEAVIILLVGKSLIGDYLPCINDEKLYFRVPLSHIVV